VFISGHPCSTHNMLSDQYFLITIDVEDWFHVENFKQWIPFSSWDSFELRVEKSTHLLLDLFDSFDSTRNPKPETRKPIKATFFILGWIAERLPNLVSEIHARGHEVASHGYNHNLCTGCSLDDLKKDLVNSKKLLEDIIGDRVYGYRAPNFSITDDILKIIKDSGYLYDSSFNSFNFHDRYGKISLDNMQKQEIAINISKIQNPASSSFYELPISNLCLIKNIKSLLRNIQFCSSSRKTMYLTAHIQGVFRGLNSENDTEIGQKRIFTERLILPWGGGAYFRIIPFPIFKMGVDLILKKDLAYLFYLHPWEADPKQPRVEEASAFFKFRHCINLNKTYSKLSKLIESFEHCNFITCSKYLEERSNSIAQ